MVCTWQWRLGRKLQLIAERNEVKGYHEGGQSWKTFLENHRTTMASMDFKVTFDWRGKLLYILNIIDHERRELIVCRATHTLPNMGIKVVRTSIGCPWQNGVVERFNRTLTEELLNHIIPISAQHINRLLKQYQTFYNTARPHRTLDGQSPIWQETAANEATFMPGTLRAEAIAWLGGLHHSYRRAA